MPEIDTPLEENNLVAAEYVLGLPDAAEMAQLAARRSTDPAFAQAVERWERRLAPFFDEVLPVDAPDALWGKIMSELQNRETGHAVNDAAPAGKLRFWRFYGGIMTAAAAALVVALIARPDMVERQPVPETEPAPEIEAPEPEMRPATLGSATLAPEDGTPVAVITYEAESKRLFVSPVGIPADSGTVPQLWFIPSDGVPRSLGTIEAGATITLQLAEDFDEAATLAISIEPAGGSPTGAPTGPIVGTGKLSEL